MIANQLAEQSSMGWNAFLNLPEEAHTVGYIKESPLLSVSHLLFHSLLYCFITALEMTFIKWQHVWGPPLTTARIIVFSTLFSITEIFKVITTTQPLSRPSSSCTDMVWDTLWPGASHLAQRAFLPLRTENRHQRHNNLCHSHDEC
jgi:hypothetical protein